MSTWTWETALTGVVPPLISPLDNALQPDAGASATLVEHVLQGGCTGLFVLGGCGEGPWLTTAQRGGVSRAAVRAAAGRAPVLGPARLPLLPYTIPPATHHTLSPALLADLARERRVLGIKDSAGDFQ